ncbi:MAG: glucose-1-phosphate thymidylyltransferase [Flavobacteriales bacterium]|nr:glucose-1-phosphate thymidylyltransferase [Flavobacteriales bacterium]
MNLILFDGPQWKDLYPLTLTRPVAELRLGISTLREKWELRLGTTSSTCTESYLQTKYPLVASSDNLVVNAAVLPQDLIVDQILKLKPEQRLQWNGQFIAGRTHLVPCHLIEAEGMQDVEAKVEPVIIRYPWDVFRLNEVAMALDMEMIKPKQNGNTGRHNVLLGDKIYIHETAEVQAAVLNSETGPIWIGPGAKVMEGAMLRGPIAVCEGAEVKMGAKIYGPTTIGPHCKVGGELNNVVITGYTNKAHDGFLGNSVIGEWCNLGADTNCSNLKNNYGEVRVHHMASGKAIGTGLQFCGLIMGDHSKAGINTMFNTGTVAGVNANIFGGGFQSKFIPSFSWGGEQQSPVYEFDKAAAVAEQVMGRRGKTFEETDRQILRHVYDHR